MAIKDSIINEILKSEATPKSSQLLYKRLREIPPTPLTNSEETEHKGNTNQTQIISIHKLDTIQTQTEHKIIDKPNTNHLQTEHKLNTKVNTNHDLLSLLVFKKV